MTEQADRFTLTIGPDGRGLLTLALRRLPRADADGYARAQRYWACTPAAGRPRWLALSGGPDILQRPGELAEDPREAAEAHAAAAAYVPGVACSWCGDRWWKPMNREVVSRYVLTGLTGGCLTCRQQPAVAAPPAAAPRPAPAPADLAPAQTAEARILPAVTVRVDGAAAAMLWSATGGDTQTMSSLVTDLISRNFGIPRVGGALR
ncbi:hypothetical protein ACTOB_003294 [Actinoplanes oblitus]|uniref:Uncharacterized protein n=1 Tax=Actinoplanes oblitus TaxID=3040509 RepID=A0ABY8WP12_9ACTN|nr:hypothetical protein [Actinoplanes oblitus]WIM99634.1 hypothetical protein ACTOB_003294 [Actinoplanes oblitus]